MSKFYVTFMKLGAKKTFMFDAANLDTAEEICRMLFKHMEYKVTPVMEEL